MNTLQTKTLILILLVVCAFGSVASAARIDTLYAAEVALGGGANALPNAFAAALELVLVKVTGRRDLAANGDAMARFGDPSRLVQQYRIDAGNLLWVQFDEVALRRELDRIGEPVWGVERPTVVVWILLDEGFGQRRLIGSEPEAANSEPLATDGGANASALILEELAVTAEARGLPLIVPPVDALERTEIPLGDVWGGYTESLVTASAPFRPDAILIGRARPAAFDRIDVRWTLLRDDERYDWEGDVPAGPNDVADFFAARLSTSVGSATQIVLNVDDVDSLDAYGRVSTYLAQLDLVEEIAVDLVDADRVVYRLKIRGDADRLMRSIALQRVLQPVDDPQRAPTGDPFQLRTGAQSLYYRLMAAQ